MRAFIENFGCPECLEARKAVNIFNAKRTPDKWIKIIELKGIRMFQYFAEESEWYNLAVTAFEEDERLRVPILIFDDILVKGLDDFKSYLAMLEELDKKVEI